MKKILTLCAAVVFAAGAFAQSYGILVNGSTYFAGEKVDEFEGFQQYLAHVPVKSGDYCQLYDYDNKAAWANTLNAASVSAFTRSGDRYNCSQDGCYDFYIKLKYGQDELYIGDGSNCGEGVEIGGGTTPPVDVPDSYWYYKGWIDGGDLQNEEGGFNIFQGGTASLAVEENAYLFVMYQEKGKQGVQYMAAEYVDGPTHATMLTSGNEKLHVGPGMWTLYLYDNGDGTVELSTEPLPGKTLIGGGEQAIDHTNANEKAHKAIIDGQLRIIRGDKMFDATGRQL